MSENNKPATGSQALMLAGADALAMARRLAEALDTLLVIAHDMAALHALPPEKKMQAFIDRMTERMVGLTTVEYPTIESMEADLHRLRAYINGFAN